MNENEFELDGKVYVAVGVTHESCHGCAVYHKFCSLAPMCIQEKRKDNRNVIFVEKPQ